MTIKDLIQKITIATIALGTILGGTALVPALAFADNGLHLGVGIYEQGDNENEDDDHKKNKKIKIHDDLGISIGMGNIDIHMQNTTGDDAEVFKNIIKPAKKAFKLSVKDANSTFKYAKKTAQADLRANIHASENQASHIAAIKTYLNDILTAFRTRSAAIEAAFQAFINLNFNANQAPISNSQSVVVHQNTSVNITLTGSNPEGSALTYIIVNNTTHGTLSGTAPNLIYTPSGNFTGQDNFTFKVNDGSQDSTQKTVSITVNP